MTFERLEKRTKMSAAFSVVPMERPATERLRGVTPILGSEVTLPVDSNAHNLVARRNERKSHRNLPSLGKGSETISKSAIGRLRACDHSAKKTENGKEANPFSAASQVALRTGDRWPLDASWLKSPIGSSSASEIWNGGGGGGGACQVSLAGC